VTDKSLQAAAGRCLMIADPLAKCAATQALAREVENRDWVDRLGRDPVDSTPVPGRPAKPELVDSRKVRKRGPGSVEGRAGLYHALAHIEFNAINLALDAVYRFTDLPHAYAADWIRVADDEARHFQMLVAHLDTLGYRYGDMPAHARYSKRKSSTFELGTGGSSTTVSNVSSTRAKPFASCCARTRVGF